ncbi:hypothetical protein Dimus_014750 [Dionaea muscipula]
MFPSNTPQNPFADHYSISLDIENPSTFLFNFPPHLLDDDELLLGHFLQHHHHQPLPAATSGDEGATPALPQSPDVRTEKACKAITTKSSSNKRKEKDKTDHDAAAEQKPPEAAATMAGKKKKRATTRQTAATPRRRTGKKDRHSKIYTAQGPRDRRMRLSLQIARKFFDLQDMLGFDKASKTIEWLFTKSKAAIKDLTSSLPQKKNLSCGSASSATSECIGMETLIEETHHHHHVNHNIDASSSDHRQGPEQDIANFPKRKNKLNTTRKRSASLQQQYHDSHTPHSHPSLARESRDKARARARQRTREKMLQKEMEIKGDQNRTNPNNDGNCNRNTFDKLGSSSTTPETTYEESAQDFNSSIEISPPPPPSGMGVKGAEKYCCNAHDQHQQHSLEHGMASVGIVEKLVGASSRSTSSSIAYDYQQLDHHPHEQDQGFLGFAGHSWMAESAGINSTTPAPCYDIAMMMNNGSSSSIISGFHEQNPNNSFFMASSDNSIYLQQQHPHHYHHFLQNQFSCSNNSLEDNSNPSLF